MNVLFKFTSFHQSIYEICFTIDTEEILQRTYDENIDEARFQAVVDRFNGLRKELEGAAENKISYLPDIDYEDKLSEAEKLERSQWKEILSEYVKKGDTWLSAPWCVTEFYVYRKLMDAIGYFDPSSPGYRYDPFTKEKRKGLESSVASAEGVMEKIVDLPATKEGIALAAAFALWGNKMDLSIWPTSTAEGLKEAFNKILKSSADNLLHDDISVLTDHCEKLRSSGGGSVDIIVDNAGFELVVDLALADHLIASGIASSVTFQLKAHPTFVSDALEKDLLETVSYYSSLDKGTNPNCHAAGERWSRYLDEAKWICNEDFFWVQPLPMWEMHDDIYNEITGRCDLAFVKGDANYRRLLGDRYWDYSTPFEKVVGSYFPCPVCALRTLKAEVSTS